MARDASQGRVAGGHIPFLGRVLNGSDGVAPSVLLCFGTGPSQWPAGSTMAAAGVASDPVAKGGPWVEPAATPGRSTSDISPNIADELRRVADTQLGEVRHGHICLG